MPRIHGSDKEQEARRLRQDEDWNLDDIASELKVSVSTVHRWTKPGSMAKARRYARTYAQNNQDRVVERQRQYREDRKKNPALYEEPRRRISQIIEPPD